MKREPTLKPKPKPKPKPKQALTRREPKQRRSRETVNVVLDAVVRLLKREGVQSVTTNRIAQIAGVSVGSIYQYFPNKRAIYSALHERHVDEAGRLLEKTLVEHAESSLEELVRALIDAMVEAHQSDPELHELLTNEIPPGSASARAFEQRVRGAFALAISARTPVRQKPRELEHVLFALPHLVEALSHGAALHRPARVSLSAAKAEAVRAVMAYLRA